MEKTQGVVGPAGTKLNMFLGMSCCQDALSRFSCSRARDQLGRGHMLTRCSLFTTSGTNAPANLNDQGLTVVFRAEVLLLA